MTEIANREVRAQFNLFCTKLEKKLKKTRVDSHSDKIQQVLTYNRGLKRDYDNLKSKIVDLKSYAPKHDSIEATAFNALFKDELKSLNEDVASAKKKMILA